MARIKILSVRLSAGEYIAVGGAAQAAGSPAGTWIRHQALRAASALPEPTPRPSPAALDPPAGLVRTVSTRLSAEQFEALDERAQACGLPVSSLVRKILLGLNPVPRRPIVRSAIVAVNRVGNNLNQLTHLAHTGVVLAPDLVRVLAEIQARFEALQDALLAADAADAREAEEPEE